MEQRRRYVLGAAAALLVVATAVQHPTPERLLDDLARRDRKKQLALPL